MNVYLHSLSWCSNADLILSLLEWVASLVERLSQHSTGTSLFPPALRGRSSWRRLRCWVIERRGWRVQSERRQHSVSHCAASHTHRDSFKYSCSAGGRISYTMAEWQVRQGSKRQTVWGGIGTGKRGRKPESFHTFCRKLLFFGWQSKPEDLIQSITQTGTYWIP